MGEKRFWEGYKKGMDRIEKQKQEIVAMFLPFGDTRFNMICSVLCIIDEYITARGRDDMISVSSVSP